jgi:hypothetical protein
MKREPYGKHHWRVITKRSGKFNFHADHFEIGGLGQITFIGQRKDDPIPVAVAVFGPDQWLAFHLDSGCDVKHDEPQQRSRYE